MNGRNVTTSKRGNEMEQKKAKKNLWFCALFICFTRQNEFKEENRMVNHLRQQSSWQSSLPDSVDFNQESFSLNSSSGELQLGHLAFVLQSLDLLRLSAKYFGRIGIEHCMAMKKFKKTDPKSEKETNQIRCDDLYHPQP